MRRVLASATAVFLVTSAGVFAKSPAAAARVAAQGTAREHPGKALMETVCASCHDTRGITETPRTKANWVETLEQMIQYGASAGDNDFEQIFDYLLRNYSIVNVNTAPASELEIALDVTDTVAKAIVAYREENGLFATIDDLKHVPGIDAAKLDARATRLRY